MKNINPKFKSILATLIINCFLLPTAFADSIFIDNKGRVIQLEVAKQMPYTMVEDQNLFVASFWDCYQNIEPEAIKPHFKTGSDVQNWINDVFIDEEKQLTNDFAKKPSQRTEFYVQAKYNGKLVGLIFFERERGKPNEIYLRQMAVKIGFQKSGIGKNLVFSILKDKDLLPNINVIHVVVRKRNVPALKFYEKIGFIESGYLHPDYSPDYYVGIDWNKNQTK